MGNWLLCYKTKANTIIKYFLLNPCLNYENKMLRLLLGQKSDLEMRKSLSELQCVILKVQTEGECGTCTLKSRSPWQRMLQGAYPLPSFPFLRCACGVSGRLWCVQRDREDWRILSLARLLTLLFYPSNQSGILEFRGHCPDELQQSAREWEYQISGPNCRCQPYDGPSMNIIPFLLPGILRRQHFSASHWTLISLHPDAL